MEESPKDRITAFIKHIGISTAGFEKEVGISNGYLRSLRHRPSERVIKLILSRYPELNKTWLLCGEGEMIYPSSIEGEAQKESKMMIDMLETQVSYLKKQIEIKDAQINKLINSIEELKSWKK